MNATRQVLTIKQVAEFLQVSTDTVYRLATSGELQGRKIGRLWRFPKSAVEVYLRAGSSVDPNRSIARTKRRDEGAGGDPISATGLTRTTDTQGRDTP